jgi:hypothetical protein
VLNPEREEEEAVHENEFEFQNVFVGCGTDHCSS